MFQPCAEWWRNPGLWLGDGDVSPAPRPGASSSDPRPAGDPYRVLVVDDEDLIRRLASGMARRLQVEVLTAATAAEALDLVRTTRVDALVIDVMLGDGIDGIELARQVVAAQPWLAIILMSGYLEDDYALEGLPRDTQFLNKPFSGHGLAQCLARARGQAPSNH